MKISRRGYEENDERSFSPKELIRLKKAKEEYHIDGFNLIITLEVALSKKILIIK